MPEDDGDWDCYGGEEDDILQQAIKEADTKKQLETQLHEVTI